MIPKPSTNPKDKLFDLLEQINEGTFSEPDRMELNELLRRHPELVQNFIEYREQCASLKIMYLQCHKTANIANNANKTPLFPELDSGTSSSVLLPGESPRFSFSGSSKFIISLLAMFVIALTVSYTFLGTGFQGNTTRPVATAPLPVVARLVATDQCRWTMSGAKTVPQPGEKFRQGAMLELAAGLAQIHYESGVSILFQGPGRLELVEPNTVCLYSGVVISRVSPEAIGFTVNTPGSKVIDHGTEFAVGVDENQKTEVSVLNGKVELKKRRNHRAADSRMLTAGQSLRLSAKGEIELFRTIDPSRLAKNLTESNNVKQHHAQVSIYRLRSASELKLKGTLVRAINVGSKKGIQVGDIFFEPDDPSVLDSAVIVGSGWGNLPWLGNSPDDKALCQVLHSIRHNLARNGNYDPPHEGRPVSARLSVVPGRYRIQLLISENHHARNSTDRSINLDIEGVPCLRDMRTLASQGIAGHPIPPNQALLIDVELDVADEDLLISLFSSKVPDGIDPNVILNGLIVERL